MPVAAQDCDPALPLQLQRVQAIAYAPGTVVQLTIADPPRTGDQRSALCALPRKVADLVEQTTGAGHNRQNSPDGLLLTYTPGPVKTMSCPCPGCTKLVFRKKSHPRPSVPR